MKTMNTAQDIKNTTLRKLSWMEIGELGLFAHGVLTYHGQLKARKRGYKTEVVSDWQINFVAEHYRIEFIKIEQTDETTNWAMRVYDTDRQAYDSSVPPLIGVEFFK